MFATHRAGTCFVALAALLGANLSGVDARKNRDGASGLRCQVCEAVTRTAKKQYSKEGKRFDASRFLKTIEAQTCFQTALSSLPNPKNYALHIPTIKFECEDVIEQNGGDLIDALTLSENMNEFCVEQDLCERKIDVEL